MSCGGAWEDHGFCCSILQSYTACDHGLETLSDVVDVTRRGVLPSSRPKAKELPFAMRATKYLILCLCCSLHFHFSVIFFFKFYFHFSLLLPVKITCGVTMFLQPGTEKSIPVTSGTLTAFWGKGLFRGGVLVLSHFKFFGIFLEI